jgi:restriction endonuclease S subunit
VKALELPLASVEEQRSIARILMTHTALCAETQHQLVNLHQQKHGLMHDLLTCRVRVKVDESASV